jgi:hypothetical protein
MNDRRSVPKSCTADERVIAERGEPAPDTDAAAWRGNEPFGAGIHPHRADDGRVDRQAVVTGRDQRIAFDRIQEEQDRRRQLVRLRRHRRERERERVFDRGNARLELLRDASELVVSAFDRLGRHDVMRDEVHLLVDQRLAL